MDINATLLVEMVIFLVFFMITKHFIWPPIINVLDERREIISSGLKQADEARRELANAQQEAEAIIHKAAAEAKYMIHEAQKEAEVILSQTKKTCQQRLNALDKELGAKVLQAEKNAKKNIQGEMLQIATALCQKVLANSIDQKTMSQLIETQTKAEN